ncbi:hypothetical protein C8K44_13526, partial [Aminobacter sp. AP02]
ATKRPVRIHLALPIGGRANADIGRRSKFP